MPSRTACSRALQGHRVAEAVVRRRHRSAAPQGELPERPHETDPSRHRRIGTSDAPRWVLPKCRKLSPLEYYTSRGSNNSSPRACGPLSDCYARFDGRSESIRGIAGEVRLSHAHVLHDQAIHVRWWHVPSTCEQGPW